MAMQQPVVNKRGTKEGTRERGKNFSQVSLEALLELLENHLSVGQQQWDAMTFEYNRRTQEGRDSESLKNKFKKSQTYSRPNGMRLEEPNVFKAKWSAKCR